jgi:hypothetical protein
VAPEVRSRKIVILVSVDALVQLLPMIKERSGMLGHPIRI